MPSVERSIRPRARVPLAPFTTLGIGGDARWFVRAASVDDVAAAHRWCREENRRLVILGGGSNVVISDSGFDGLVLHIDIRGFDFLKHQDETTIHVGAGEAWDGVVDRAVARDLAGLECLSGIPGSVGGTPIQNVGAYGQEVGDTIGAVTAFDRTSAQVVTLTGRDCDFRYRMSRFKRQDAGRFIVCDVAFRLQMGPPRVVYPDVIEELSRRRVTAPTLADVRSAVLSIRRRKGMVIDAADVDTRSVGSFFVNPVVSPDVHARLESLSNGAVPAFPAPDGRVKIPAAWLIERAGFARGYQSGSAGLSSKHPLAIVNRGGATAADVVALAIDIKRQVADRFGIWLKPEPAFVGFDDDNDVGYLLDEGVRPPLTRG